MNSNEHQQQDSIEQLKARRRGKSREVTSRFLSPSSPNRRYSSSSKGIEVESKENRRPSSPWNHDAILLGRFSIDESALYRSSSLSSRRNSCSLLYDYNDSDSESSFASSTTTHRKAGIDVPSKYLREKQSNKHLKEKKNMTKRANPVASYGSSMSQWALSPGRSFETPTSKPPRGGKLFNLGFDFFRSKKTSSPFSSPLKPKTSDPETAHQLKLLHTRLLQWRFVNARASAANNTVDSRVKKQVLCGWDTLTKLKHLVLQQRIELEKHNLEMKLYHMLPSQIKHLEAWEDMEVQHSSSLSMTTQALHSLLSRLPLREGAQANIESAAASVQEVEAVTDAIVSAVNSFAPMMESIVPLASQLAELVAQEKLMLEQCHEFLRMISELEVQERALKCCFLIQHKQTMLDTKLPEQRLFI